MEDIYGFTTDMHQCLLLLAIYRMTHQKRTVRFMSTGLLLLLLLSNLFKTQ